MEQHMVIVRPVSAWARQADEALTSIRAANGGEDPPTLTAAAALGQQAFASLIEAMVALEPVTHRKVSGDLISLARLRPVDRNLGRKPGRSGPG